MEDIIRAGSLRLFATESCCDVVLSCVGYKLMAHKLMLSIASPVLQDLLLQNDTSPTTVLIFPDISATTMTLVLDYIYTGHVALQSVQLADFMCVAKLLQLKLDCDDKSVKYCDYACAKTMPGLIPIGKMKVKKGLFNKVIPSPWMRREAQVFKDPRVDHVKSDETNDNEKHIAFDLMTNKNDTNNNTVADTPQSVHSPSKSPRLTPPPESPESQEVHKSPDAGAQHPKEKPYKCGDCGKTFSQLRNYKYHRSIHDGTKEFSARCPECGKVFNDRGYLSSHMKIHRDRKEYACQHCPKRFNQRVAYNMHLRIHTGVKPHECGVCGKSFSRKMLLKQHQRVHTGERPYTCAECGKSFADRSNMSLHARLHTGEKPYACTLCNKSFTKKHHLKTHMNFHTGLKPYSCQQCGLAFSQSSNMRTHFKKCVLKMPPEVT